MCCGGLILSNVSGSRPNRSSERLTWRNVTRSEGNSVGRPWASLRLICGCSPAVLLRQKMCETVLDERKVCKTYEPSAPVEPVRIKTLSLDDVPFTSFIPFEYVWLSLGAISSMIVLYSTKLS